MICRGIVFMSILLSLNPAIQGFYTWYRVSFQDNYFYPPPLKISPYFKRERKTVLLVWWLFVKIKKVLDLTNSMKCWRVGMAKLRVHPTLSRNCIRQEKQFSNISIQEPFPSIQLATSHRCSTDKCPFSQSLTQRS